MIGRHARTRAGVLGAVLRNPRDPGRRRGRSSGARWSCSTTSASARAPTTPAGSLAYGDQRRLEIARALATEPKLLALDEPAAGMNPAERIALGKLIRRIRDDGVTRAADRARRAAGDERLRPRDGARLRREDRRRHAGGSAEGPEGDRGLPGSAACCLRSKNLEVHYGGIRAVKGIDLEVGRGRAGLPDRRQRRRQDHDAEGDLPADRRRTRKASLRGRGHLPARRSTSCRARAW